MEVEARSDEPIIKDKAKGKKSKAAAKAGTGAQLHITLNEKYITGEMLVILIGTSFYMQQPLGVFMETPFYDYHELLQSAD